MANPDKVDARELSVDIVNVGGNPVKLISCEHNPRKMRPRDPWPQIAREIGGSKLIVAEYFQPELDQTAFKTPILGLVERLDARRDGITGFSNKVAELAIANGSEIAVADIANRPNYMLYYFAYRLGVPALAALAHGEGLPVAMDIALSSLIAYIGILSIGDGIGRFIFHPRPQTIDDIFFDLSDARRVFTAKALMQIAETKPVYIAPPAHTKRVKRYMENPNSVVFKLRNRLYRSFIGLDRSIRYFRFDQDQSDWQKFASEPIH